MSYDTIQSPRDLLMLLCHLILHINTQLFLQHLRCEVSKVHLITALHTQYLKYISITFSILPQYIFLCYIRPPTMVSYSRTCPRAFFSFLILLLVTGATSATEPFYFNSTLISNCYTSLSANCSLLNPAFWDQNGTVPSSPEDTVFVITNDTNPVSLYLIGTTLNIASLTISGLVTLEVATGSLLEVHFLSST